MEITNYFATTIKELQKLSFEFYTALAKGKEPLTFTAVDSDGNEHQVEVNVPEHSEQIVLISIGFDTNFGGRFDKSTGSFYSYNLDKDGNWDESSK